MTAPSPATSIGWRTLLLLAALAIWLGGLVFYATLVIPTGADVLGGHTPMGFITRQVTNKLNLLGTGIVVALFVDRMLGRPPTTRAMWFALGAMAVCQVLLFMLHPWLEAMLDLQNSKVAEYDSFYFRHQLYLWTTMLQWFAGVFYSYNLVRAR